LNALHATACDQPLVQYVKRNGEVLVSRPLIVSIPHNLGREEAVRRMKSGLAHVREQYGHFFTMNEEKWTGDQLNFSVTALAQNVSGLIDVADDHVKLEITLPWLLARLASGVQTMIRDKGRLMLEKK
jgi:Putative polyhydroxyalkanoic acid system protein (PHA_gran_rgn)